ncbi:MAG: MAPEG family protein [Myxococcota bacterium]
MTIDLWMLLGCALLQWVLIMGVSVPLLVSHGLAWGAGNRDLQPTTTGWVGRTQRASDNLRENLPLFAILVLVAHVSGAADSMSATGAVLFFSTRVAHALVYIVGIPYLRTLMWMASIGGLVLILLSIVT